MPYSDMDRRLSPKIYACVIAALLVAACDDRPRRAETAEEAIQITNRFWKEEFPQVNLNNLTANATDLNDRWKITYGERGYAGGLGWEFEVDKKSGKIIKVKGSQ